MERYGVGPPTDAAERLFFLMDVSSLILHNFPLATKTNAYHHVLICLFGLQKVTEFTQDAISLTTGEELKCGDKLNVFSTLREEFGKWNAHLDLSGEKCMYRFGLIYRCPPARLWNISGVLQLTTGLRGRWWDMRRSTVEENCPASSTTRPLRLWSRSKSNSWKSRLSRSSRI